MVAEVVAAMERVVAPRAAPVVAVVRLLLRVGRVPVPVVSVQICAPLEGLGVAVRVQAADRTIAAMSPADVSRYS